MIKNIFKKFKNSLSKKKSDHKQTLFVKPNFRNELELLKNKSKVIRFDGNNYDSNFIDQETLNIYNLLEKSNSKINFFEDLLANLKIDRNKKILKLKHKLQEEKSIS